MRQFPRREKLWDNKLKTAIDGRLAQWVMSLWMAYRMPFPAISTRNTTGPSVALRSLKKKRERKKSTKMLLKITMLHVSSFKTETICHHILRTSKRLQPAWSQRKALKWIQNGREQCCAIFHGFWPLSSLIVLSYRRYTASCSVTVCQSKRTFKPGVPGRPAPPSLPGAPWNRRTLFHTWLSLRPLAMMSKPTGFPGYPCGPAGPALPFPPCKCHYHYRQLSSSEICYIFFHVTFWGPVVILEKAAGCLTGGPAFPGNPTVPAGPAEP